MAGRRRELPGRAEVDQRRYRFQPPAEDATRMPREVWKNSRAGTPMIQKTLLVGAGVLVGAAIAWFALGTGPTFDVDPAAAARGESLYQVCAACHGDKGQGNPDTRAPRLAGQYPWYLEQQLRNFRDGLRGTDSGDVNGQVMRPMALALADDQAVADVVAYIATLKP